MTSKINQLCEKLRLKFNQNKTLYDQVYLKLADIVCNVTTDALSDNEGYCTRFKLSFAEKNDLLCIFTNDLKITKNDIFDAFKADWGSDAIGKLREIQRNFLTNVTQMLPKFWR